MKRYVIDEKGRALNTLHFPNLYTDERGSWHVLKIPTAVMMSVKELDVEVVVGDTFTAYGGKFPEKRRYVEVSNFRAPVTAAMRERERRRMKRCEVASERANIPAWRYPLVPVRQA